MKGRTRPYDVLDLRSPFAPRALASSLPPPHADLTRLDIEYVNTVTELVEHAGRLGALSDVAAYDSHMNTELSVLVEEGASMWDTLLARLLHAYALYIPTGCWFVEDELEAHIVWRHPTGGTVADVLTTSLLLHAFPDAHERLIAAEADWGRSRFGEHFVGVRHLVLDNPLQSTLRAAGRSHSLWESTATSHSFTSEQDTRP